MYEAMVRDGKMTEEFLENALASWRGYAKFGDAYRLIEKRGL